MLNFLKYAFYLSFFMLLVACTTNTQEGSKEKGYITKVGEGTEEIKILVVSGTPYEMGLEQGKLLKDEIQENLDNFLSFTQQEANSIYNEEQFYKALDDAWVANSPYIDQRVIDEMKGISEGSGATLQMIQRAHMIPVISPYSCSGVIVWGKATKNNHTYQLRNLDFTMGAKLQDHPVVTIYKPANGTAHANVSFAGYIASHTGMNANHIVFGEKGQSPGKEFPYDIKGVHFSFLFRALMYDATSLDNTLDMVKSAQLIKRYFLFFGDGNSATMGGAKALVSTPDEVKLSIWKDNDPKDIVAPNVLENVVYYTMDNGKAFELLKKNLGSFDEQKMIEISKTVASPGGNLVDVVYDATTLEMWVAYANGSEDAAKQPYVHINMNDYLK